MKTEKIIKTSSSRCINVSANKVTSLRINNETYNTVRVYDNGFIGVEGRIGSADFDEMKKSAAEKLKQQITYPETHDAPVTREIDAAKYILSEKEFIPQIKKLLSRLEQENPDFLFSNKVILRNDESSYENSDGSFLRYSGGNLTVSLATKHKGSANIMDEFCGGESDVFDIDKICRDAKMKCDAFLNYLPQIEDDEAYVIGDFEPIYQFIEHFLADLYFNKSSLLDGKLGQRVFSEKFSLAINRDPEKQINLPFFDDEGVVNKDYVNYIVKNGVLERVLTCKKSAAKYNVENTGSSSASYDGVPDLGAMGLYVSPTANELQEIVKGKAVYISMTSGANMTPSGDLSIPAQSAYLYENGKLAGRLPEMTVSGNVFDILGKDFVGVCENGFYEFGRQNYFVYKAKLINKAQ